MNEPVPNLPPESIPPAPAPRAAKSIFRGPHGIRAGWRIAIYLAFAAVVAFVLVFIAGVIARGRNLQVTQITPLGTMLTEAGIFLVAAIPAVIMARIEHRGFGDYGLPGRSMLGRNFWIGGIVGFASISACLLGIFALGGFRLTGLGIHGSAIPAATIAWAIAFLVVGLAEEFSFRGYLQFTLTSGIGFWPAAFVLSGLFGLAHSRNPGETTAGLVSVVLFGLLFCLFLRRTGNLWWAVGFHAGWDWGQTFFYGVPDSGMVPYHNLLNCTFSGPAWLTGGTVGPEASVFTPTVLVIAGIIFSRVYRDNRYQTVDRLVEQPATRISPEVSSGGA